METKTKIGAGIIGLLTILSVFGGYLVLTPEQLSNTFYCTASEEIGIFYGGISGTGLTAYPYTENRSDYVRCQKAGIKGTWILLTEYAEELGIDPIELISKPKDILNKEIIINYPNGKSYECVFEDLVINDTIQSKVNCELK
jgi:hypothetical protein